MILTERHRLPLLKVSILDVSCTVLPTCTKDISPLEPVFHAYKQGSVEDIEAKLSVLTDVTILTTR